MVNKRCQRRFVGPLALAAAEARAPRAKSRSNADEEATHNLAQACCEQGRHAEALRLWGGNLKRQLNRFQPDHLTVASTKNKYSAQA